MHKELHNRVMRAIHERTFPGCVIGILKEGTSDIFPFGSYTYESDSPLVEEKTVYDCASITKSIPLAILALRAIEKGKLRLSDMLIHFVPEYSGAFRDTITIHHLLTYTAPSISLAELKHRSAQEILEGIVRMQPTHTPGERFFYSNVPAFLLGLCIERISGPLDRSAHEEIFQPLHMKSTTFWPIQAAPTEEGVQNIVHDESARAFAQMLRAVGHAGLFSNVPDLLHFFEVLLKNDGTILASQTIDSMTTNQIPHLKKTTGLGWELDQPHWMGSLSSPRTFGKTGFTGTSVLCSMERKFALVILSNRTYPHRPIDGEAINALRRDVANIVCASS